MTERQPYTFDRVVRILFGAVFVVGLFYLIYILRGALLPFLVAWIVAYMLNPLVEYNKRVFKLKGRVLAITLTFVEVIITFALLCVLVLPSVIDEIGVMRKLLSDYVYNSSSIPFVPQEVHDFIQQNIDFSQLSSLLSREHGSRLSRIVSRGPGDSSPVRWARLSTSSAGSSCCSTLSLFCSTTTRYWSGSNG